MNICVFIGVKKTKFDRVSELLTCNHGVKLPIDTARRKLGLPRLDDEEFRKANKRLQKAK